MKRVLILGSGIVAAPMVQYLMSNGIRVLIASPLKERAERMLNENSLGAAIDWSMDDPETLDFLIGEHDLTVSLLPFVYHTDVASKCLRHRKPLVTTSYVQTGMMSLDEKAKQNGVIFLNETGLDPGINIMTARKIIDNIHKKGGIAEEIYSICGSLPAHDHVDNPVGHKFILNPKGVILAGKSGAEYLLNGDRIKSEPAELYRDKFTISVTGAGRLEVYPDNDSISYIGILGIPGARTVYKGIFRHKGWCETMDALINLNLLDENVRNYSGMTSAGFLSERSGCPLSNLKQAIAQKLGKSPDSIPMRSLEFLDFFSDEVLDYKKTTPFHITSDRMIGKMQLKESEKDMVVLLHVILASYPGGKKEVIKSSMIAWGTPATNTAIAKTVALPAAISARLILEKKISAAGVVRPVLPEIYNPVTDELRSLGIEMKEEYGLPESEMIHGYSQPPDDPGIIIFPRTSDRSPL